jgi:hypothetical protein
MSIECQLTLVLLNSKNSSLASGYCHTELIYFQIYMTFTLFNHRSLLFIEFY